MFVEKLIKAKFWQWYHPQIAVNLFFAANGPN
jgi:hypothetical protein